MYFLSFFLSFFPLRLTILNKKRNLYARVSIYNIVELLLIKIEPRTYDKNVGRKGIKTDSTSYNESYPYHRLHYYSTSLALKILLDFLFKRFHFTSSLLLCTFLVESD